VVEAGDDGDRKRLSLPSVAETGALAAANQMLPLS
jgi:hypothetical protein